MTATNLPSLMLFKQVSGTLEYDVNEPPTRFKKSLMDKPLSIRTMYAHFFTNNGQFNSRDRVLATQSFHKMINPSTTLLNVNYSLASVHPNHVK